MPVRLNLPQPRLLHPGSHYTQPRPWQPLSDSEWSALLPYVLRRSASGRPIAELRTRIDAIFWIARSGKPWRELPEHFGKPDTVSRYFRRLTHNGLWQRLLEALAEASLEHPLSALAHWICRACRRATRILGLKIIILARRLGFLSALKGPHWMVANPDLSESILKFPLHLAFTPEMYRRRGPNPVIAALKHLHSLCGGRQRIPKSLEPA